MRITGMKVEKVTIPLIAPFKVAFATVEALESVLIRVETDEGCVGFGEASPLCAGDRRDVGRSHRGAGHFPAGADRHGPHGY